MIQPDRDTPALKPEAGLTLIEMMVALAIGSFLIIGAVQIYTQSRQSYLINESVAKVQDTATFAMDTLETDLRMASNWGRTSRGLSIEGRSLSGDANPTSLPGIPTQCGEDWVLDLAMPVDGDNNDYTLPCGTTATRQANSDHIIVRRATHDPAPLENGRPQIQTTRVSGRIFTDGAVPAGYAAAVRHEQEIIGYLHFTAAQGDVPR